MSIFLLLSVPLTAQVYWVPKAGINFSNLEVNAPQYESIDVNTGFQLGIDSRIGSGKFVFNPGIHFFRTNSALEQSEQGTLIDDELKVSSLKVPLTALYFLTDPERAVRLSINAGLVPGLLLGVSDNRFALDEDDFQNASLGGRIGIKVDLINFTFGFNYEAGFTEYYQSLDGRNRIVSMTLGYIL